MKGHELVCGVMRWALILSGLAVTAARVGAAEKPAPATTRAAAAEPLEVVIRGDAALPVQKVFVLKRGDRVTVTLPGGRRVAYATRPDRFGSGEQTTRSGLKAHVAEPAFDLLKDYGVTSSDHDDVSVYRFDLDGFQVERAEDLRAEHALPVIVRVTKAGAPPLSTEAARLAFDKLPKFAGPPPRVPLATVHDGLKRKFDMPFRLVATNRAFSFDAFDEVAKLDEAGRLKLLGEAMAYVVDRLDGIDRFASFAFTVYKGDAADGVYVARKDADGRWSIARK